MKKWLVIAIFLANPFISSVHAQSDEAQQLLLNWEKLTQFRKILDNMYTGYKILNTGYTTIKDLSTGNFNLHKTFLDGLLQVSPAVKSYRRIPEIIQLQWRIAKQCKTAISECKAANQFTPAEINHLRTVISKIITESLHGIDELLMIITAGRLRMNDNERLQAIDNIYDRVADQWNFLQEFSKGAAILSIQRQKEQMEIQLEKQWLDIK